MRLLNASAKVRRYSARGSTHSSGTGATSSNNLLVMERSNMELQAERPSHSSFSRSVGASAVSLRSGSVTAAGAEPRRASHAAAEHSSTNMAKSIDHSAACLCAAMCGSISNG